MMKPIQILLLFTMVLNAESLWKLETKSPLKLLIHKVSPDGFNFASLYESHKKIDEYGEEHEQYLQMGTVGQNWWLSNNTGLVTIGEIQFIGNTHLLLIENSSTATVSVIVDMRTKKRTILANGKAEYITKGADKGLLFIHNTKSYFPKGGAYWYDELVNKEGELIRLISKPKNGWGCIPLKVILKQKYPLLQQSMDDCIYVDR